MQSQPVSDLLDNLAEAYASAENLEGLTRPLLEMLEQVTQLESTYLTTIDEPRGIQTIQFSRNSGEMRVSENLEIKWDDSPCKRALQTGQTYTDDVDACWSDSETARDLGIKTYLSQPVRLVDGTLYGTLCGASAASVQMASQTIDVLGMFASLIGNQIDREHMIEHLRMSNRELAHKALEDGLTGIPNRRALTKELGRLLAQSTRTGASVIVAFIDLDGFKAINDNYGHEFGDRFLVHISGKLSDTIRDADLIARYGGDEFVVAGIGTRGEELRERLHQATTGPFSHAGQEIDYPGVSIGVVISSPGDKDADELLRRADAAMNLVKKGRRKQLD